MVLSRCPVTILSGGVRLQPVPGRRLYDCCIQRCCVGTFLFYCLTASWLVSAGVLGVIGVAAPRRAPGSWADPGRSKQQKTEQPAATPLSLPLSAEDSSAAQARGNAGATQLAEEEGFAETKVKEYGYLKKLGPLLDKAVDKRILADGISAGLSAAFCERMRALLPGQVASATGLNYIQYFLTVVAVLQLSQYIQSVWKRSMFEHRIWDAHRKTALGRGTRLVRRKEKVALLKSLKRAGAPRLPSAEVLVLFFLMATVFWRTPFRSIFYAYLAYTPVLVGAIVKRWKERQEALKKAEEEDEDETPSPDAEKKDNKKT